MSVNSNKKQVSLISPSTTNQSTRSNTSSTNSSSTRKPSQTAESKYKALMLEKRILIAAFIVGLLATLVFLICFSTKYWIIVDLKTPQIKIDPVKGQFEKLGHYHGLWTFCRIELWDKDNVTTEYHNCEKMFFTLPESRKIGMSPQRMGMEFKMIDFRRSTIAVGIISLLFGFLSHIFTYYSIDQLRYMYKRLAGCLHFISDTPAYVPCLFIDGATCWVTIEVFRQMHKYESLNMKTHVPETDDVNFGWSYKLLWLCLILHLVPGITFIVFSRKKKRSKARSLKEARENEPVVLGRI